MRDGDGGAESKQQEQTGGRSRDPGSLTHSLSCSLSHSLTLSTEKAGAGAVCCQFRSQTLHATSQVRLGLFALDNLE